MNNKGFTVVELIITFVIVMTISLGLFSTVDSYRERQQAELYKKEITSYRNEILKAIQNDIKSYNFQRIEKLDVTDEASPCQGYDQGISIIYKPLEGSSEESKNFCFGNDVDGKAGVLYGSIKYPAPTKFIKFEQDIIDSTAENKDTGVLGFDLKYNVNFETYPEGGYLDGTTNLGYVNIYTVKKDIFSILINMKHQELNEKIELNVTFSKATGKQVHPICNKPYPVSNEAVLNLSVRDYNECGEYIFFAIANSSLEIELTTKISYENSSDDTMLRKIKNFYYAQKIIIDDSVPEIASDAFSGVTPVTHNVKLKTLDLSLVDSSKLKSTVIANSEYKNVVINNKTLKDTESLFKKSSSFMINNLTVVPDNDGDTQIGQSSDSCIFKTSENKKRVRGLTIVKNFKTVPDKSFMGCELEKITLSDTITTIGSNAFKDNLIDSIDLKKVTTIGERAFEKAFKEKKETRYVSLSNYVVDVGKYAFSNNDITDINIANSDLIIEGYEFYGNPVKKLTVGAKEINGWYGTTENFDLTITSGVKKIGDNAFPAAFDSKLYQMSNGTVYQVIFTTDPNKINYIKNNPLVSNIHYVEVDTEEGKKFVQDIENKTITPEYEYPTYLRKNGSSYTQIFGNIQKVISIGLFNATNLESIGKNAFESFSGSTLDFSKAIALTTIGDSAFYNGTAALSALSGQPSTTINVLKFAQNGALKKIGNSAFEGQRLTSLGANGLVLPDTIVSIGDRAFNGNELTKLTVKSGGIGKSAFRNDLSQKLSTLILGNVSYASDYSVFVRDAYTGLKKVTIENCGEDLCEEIDIKNDDKYRYRFGKGVTNLTINGGVIKAGSFSGYFSNGKITNVVIGENVTEIQDNAFVRNVITTVDMSNAKSLKRIGKYAFSPVEENGLYGPYANLKTLTLPSDSGNLEVIDDYAFDGQLLTDVTLPSTIKYLSGFSNNKLTSLKIPSSVETIGRLAFWNNKITSLNVPTGVKTIKDYAFSENSISSLTLPNTIEYLSGFDYNKIMKVTIPKNTVTIGTEAFKNNQIQTVDFSNSTCLETIDNEAFNQNNISTLVIPEPVATIGKKAFYGNKLSQVTLPSTLKTLGTESFKQQIYLGNTIFNINMTSEEFNAVEGSDASWKDNSVIINYK